MTPDPILTQLNKTTADALFLVDVVVALLIVIGVLVAAWAVTAKDSTPEDWEDTFPGLPKDTSPNTNTTVSSTNPEKEKSNG